MSETRRQSLIYNCLICDRHNRLTEILCNGNQNKHFLFYSCFTSFCSACWRWPVSIVSSLTWCCDVWVRCGVTLGVVRESSIIFTKTSHMLQHWYKKKICNTFQNCGHFLSHFNVFITVKCPEIITYQLFQDILLVFSLYAWCSASLTASMHICTALDWKIWIRYSVIR